ncbi:MAG: hypothetical protein IIX25_00110 [Clostridia bacterium]|nr:hypothetical protein [Clostridia bacterium]
MQIADIGVGYLVVDRVGVSFGFVAVIVAKSLTRKLLCDKLADALYCLLLLGSVLLAIGRRDQSLKLTLKLREQRQ